MTSNFPIRQVKFKEEDDNIQATYEIDSLWALGYFHSMISANGGKPLSNNNDLEEIALNQKRLNFQNSGSYEVMDRYLSEVPTFSFYNLFDGNLQEESESIDTQIKTLGKILNASSTSYFHDRDSQTVIVRIQDEFDIGYIDGILKMRTLDNEKKLAKFSVDDVSYIMIGGISNLETLRQLEQIPQKHALHQKDITQLYATLFE